MMRIQPDLIFGIRITGSSFRECFFGPPFSIIIILIATDHLVVCDVQSVVVGESGTHQLEFTCVIACGLATVVVGVSAVLPVAASARIVVREFLADLHNSSPSARNSRIRSVEKLFDRRGARQI